MYEYLRRESAILDVLKKQKNGIGGEIQLANTIDFLAKKIELKQLSLKVENLIMVLLRDIYK